jgi:hypothetical protein
MPNEELSYETHFRPTVDKYLEKIRKMQTLVRAHVADIKFELVEAEGAQENQLFDAGLHAIAEFGN